MNVDPPLLWVCTVAVPPYTHTGEVLGVHLDQRIALFDGQRVRLCAMDSAGNPAPMEVGRMLAIADAPADDDSDPVLRLVSYVKGMASWQHAWRILDLRGRG